MIGRMMKREEMNIFSYWARTRPKRLYAQSLKNSKRWKHVTTTEMVEEKIWI